MYDSSQLENIVVSEMDFGTFLCSGIHQSERITKSQFSNISLSASKSRRYHNIDRYRTSMTETCHIEGVTMKNCMDTFYGDIVSGIRSFNLGAFYCANSSFVSCQHSAGMKTGRWRGVHRGQSQPSLHQKDNTKYYTDTTYTTRQIIEEYSVFAYCTFLHCSSSSTGGAIYASSASMKVTNCSFSMCMCTTTSGNRGGGAVGLANKNWYTISSSNLTNCSSQRF